MRSSLIHGRGLFATGAFAVDEIVVVKGGHIIDRRAVTEVRTQLGPVEIQIADVFSSPQ